MTGVIQRRLDDCLAACVATIMGRSLEDTYYASAMKDDGTPLSGGEGQDFYAAWFDWAKGQGWHMDGHQFVPFHSSELEDVDEKLPDGPWIALILDYWRGIDAPHAVVMEGRSLCWDPSPPAQPPSYWVFGIVTLEPKA